MACAGCITRGRALHDTSTALRNRDLTQARRDIAVVTRSIAKDTKAFAAELRRKLKGSHPHAH